MPRSLNTCPRCGARVSQFAAGCSVCGADLERLRRTPGGRLRGAISRSSVSYHSEQALQAALFTLVMVIVALYAPLWGMALAGLVAVDRVRRGDRTMRNMAIAAFVIALIAFFVPVLPFPQLGPVWSGG